MNFLELIFVLLLQNNFDMAKNIRGEFIKNIRGDFLENLFEYYFLNFIVDVDFFSDLKFEYYCEYYPETLL